MLDCHSIEAPQWRSKGKRVSEVAVRGKPKGSELTKEGGWGTFLVNDRSINHHDSQDYRRHRSDSVRSNC
jgi:hypothetical protein